MLSLLLIVSALAADAPAVPPGSPVPVVLLQSGRAYLALSESGGGIVGRPIELFAGETSLGRGTIEWTRDDVSATRPLGDPGKAATALASGTAVTARLLPWAEEIQPGGVLRGALGEEPRTLDPAQISTFTERQIASLVHAGLVRLSPAGEVVADLAESYEQHGRTYTFHLRRGALFHSGREATSDDVKLCFQRLLAPQTASPRAWVLSMVLGADKFHKGQAASIAGLDAPDPYTVRVTLAKPFAPFLAHLAMPSAAVYDLSKGASAGTAGSFPGLGAFSLERFETGRLRLARNALSWDPPLLDAAEFAVVPKSADQLLEYETGRLDWLLVPEGDRKKFPPLIAGTPASAKERPLLATYYVGINCARGPGRDPRFRRAVALSLDRVALLKILHLPPDRVAKGILPPSLSPADPPSFLENDLPQAKALASSLATPVPEVQFWVHDASEAATWVGDYVVARLRDAGIKARVVRKPWAAFYDGIGRGEADLFFLSWYADCADPDNFLYVLFHRDNLGAAGNRFGYDDPEVNKKLSLARIETDPALRKKLYAEVEAKLLSDLPCVPLYHGTGLLAAGPKVAGLDMDPLGIVLLRRAHFLQELSP